MKTFGTAKNTINLCATFALGSLLTIPAWGQSNAEEITWNYEILEDGTPAACCESGALPPTIEVPTTIDSHAKMAIRVGAFSNNVALSGISIPNTATNIDDNAFYGCTRLISLQKADEEMQLPGVAEVRGPQGEDGESADNNVLVGHASNGETISIQPQQESEGVFFTALEPGETERNLRACVVGNVSGSEGSVVTSGLYLLMKQALKGEGSDKVFAYPCVVEVCSPSAVLVTWDLPDAEGPFFVMGLCDEAEAQILGDWETVQGIEEEEAIPYNLVEVKPKFQGADESAFSGWVSRRIIYPEAAKENGVQGRVRLQFIINTDGSVSDVTVLRSVDPALDKEAVRVVSSSPRWQPGEQEGRKVKVVHTCNVDFRLQ